jgi:ParB/RepB/Spo0J family partition protein
MSTLQTIPVASLTTGTNDRKTFGADELAELAESIKTHGLAQPPTVRPVGDQFEIVAGGLPTQRYEIVAGERRVRAMRDVLGWTEIPAIVREMSDVEASAVMLAENVHRVDLDPMEEARAYSERLALFGGSVADVAALANVPVTRVRERMALLRLIEPVALLVAQKHFPLRFAARMVDLDVNRQGLAFAGWRDHDMSYDAFSALCGRLQDEQNQECLFDLGDFMRVQEFVMAANAEVATLPTPEAAQPVGQTEIAAALGVPLATVKKWVQRKNLPTPKWVTSMGPLWNLADVLQWHAGWTERKGVK